MHESIKTVLYELIVKTVERLLHVAHAAVSVTRSSMVILKLKSKTSVEPF